MNTWIGKVLLAAAIFCFANAAWIPAKAALAQRLLQASWQRTLAGETEVRPWPWADTWPVARLRSPDRGVDLIVLEGGSGRTLAFGPGHLAGSAYPGDRGNCVIGGHRDTHFRFLRDLDPGDRLLLELPGSSNWYQVRDIEIVDSRDGGIVADAEETLLTLVTCFPLDAVDPGGPLRLVITAEPVGLLAGI